MRRVPIAVGMKIRLEAADEVREAMKSTNPQIKSQFERVMLFMRLHDEVVNRKLDEYFACQSQR